MLLNLVLVLAALCEILESKATFNNNGFDKVLMVIDDSIKESELPFLTLQSIKKAFRDASAALHIATKGYEYFRTIEVLVPSRWQSKQDYEVAGEQSFRLADIIVAPPNPSYGEKPFVVQPGDCGEPGRYVHLTPKFMKTALAGDEAKATKVAAKTLVQNWIKYRYGVYDESAAYPTTPEESICVDHRPFYPSENFTFRPSACGDLQGQMKHEDGSECRIVNNWIDHECRFFPDAKQLINSSLMFSTSLDDVVELCEDDGPNAHNAHALNEQNDRCGHRSVWSVLLDHPDFRNFKPQYADIAAVPIPDVKFFYPASLRRIVFVLDFSGSMHGCPIKSMLHAAKSAITTLTLPVELAIVKFNDRVEVLVKLSHIKSASDLVKVLTQLHSELYADGQTCIRCGMKRALKILRADNKETKGSTVVLLSDGEETLKEDENAPLGVLDLLPEIMQAGIVVHTLAVGPVASEKLTRIASATGGRSFSIGDACDSGSQYVGGFIGTTAAPRDIVVLRKDITMPTTFNGVVSKSFVIDQTVGVDTKITLSHDFENFGLNFVFTTPDGRTITIDAAKPEQSAPKIYTDEKAGTEIMVDRGIIHLRTTKPSIGKWQYIITKTFATQNASVSNGSIIVMAQPPSDQQTITLTPHPSSLVLDLSKSNRLVIYADVFQGPVPVLGARVTAEIKRENSVANLTLRDDGIGADSKANDGVYSSAFVSFETGDGEFRYSVLVVATNGSNSVFPNPSSTGLCGPKGTATIAGTPTGLFHRDASTYFAVIKAKKPNPTPPSRVKDFRVTSFQKDTRKATFAWTAPGDEGDYGATKSYEFAASGKITALVPIVLNETKRIRPGKNDTQLVPKPFGSQETLVVTIKSIETGPIYARMRSINKRGLMSEWSNVASTLLSPPLMAATLAPSTTAAATAHATTPTEPSVPATPTRPVLAIKTESTTTAIPTTTARPESTAPTSPTTMSRRSSSLLTESLTETTEEDEDLFSTSPPETFIHSMPPPSRGTSIDLTEEPEVTPSFETPIPLGRLRNGPRPSIPDSSCPKLATPEQQQIPVEFFKLAKYGKVVFEFPLEAYLQQFCEKSSCKFQ